MGVGRAAGKTKAEEAAKMAISSPLLETSINGAKGVLINITGSEDMGLDEVETAAEMVRQGAHPEAQIIFGAAFDPDMEDEMQITVIATGYDQAALEQNKSQNPVQTGTVEQESKRQGWPAAPQPISDPQPKSADAPAAAPKEEKAKAEDSEDDEQWRTIFNIFNRNN